MRSTTTLLLAGLALCLQLAWGQSDLEDSDLSAFSFRSLPSSTSLDERVPQQQQQQAPEKRLNRSKYCGRKLADALHLVCNGIYFVPSSLLLAKKSYTKEDFAVPPMWLYSLLEEEHPRTLASALVPEPLRRQARGAVDDCCRQSCSRSDMERYCGAN